MQQLGFSLEEIGRFLESSTSSPLQVLDMHLARLARQLDQQRELCDRLEHLATGLRSKGDATIEDFLGAIEAMARFEKYFSPEQHDAIRERGEQMDPERIAAAQREWEQVFADFEISMHRDNDPGGESARVLARKAQALVAEFTGGDEGIAKSLSEMYRQEGPGKVLASHGMAVDPLVFTFMSAAMRALTESDPD